MPEAFDRNINEGEDETIYYHLESNNEFFEIVTEEKVPKLLQIKELDREVQGKELELVVIAALIGLGQPYI